MLLPDVNVWLALTLDSHDQHADAKHWFDQAFAQYQGVKCTFLP
ncbi:MAG TPA: hypothetical protein VFW87_23045 [Pirellulales bacterium]|nr:hypothetical protein [Pirellulales bacterium]